MVDEYAYRETMQELPDLPCIFARAIFFGCSICHHSHRINLAEREIIFCNQPLAHQTCRLFWETLQEKCLFVQPVGKLLTHAKAMKMQCGAMQSLGLELTPETPQQPNIALLLEKALETYQNIENLPFQTIIRNITHYPFRQHRQLT